MAVGCAYLRGMGQEFAAAYPEVAHLLAERNADPDVERLLEGFAFLTAKIREKLDDEFPEVIHSLCDLFFPEYLRPLAATALLQFVPLPGLLRERQRLPRGTEVASVPVEGTSCRFRTTQDVDLLPIEVSEVVLGTPKAAHAELPRSEEDVPMRIASPAFVVSELTTAFQMGVLVLLPFLVIDLAVAAVLMAMGMMMVPPASISLPLKLLLFVVVDGWHLLVGSLLRSFSSS